MTIRRDLKELSDNKQLVRVHGAAQSLNYEKISGTSHFKTGTFS